MINALAGLMGGLLRQVYALVSNIGTEPEQVSYLAISIVVTTIIFKLLMLPFKVSQTKSRLRMTELQPQIQELQRKYKNDPQTLARKQQELYKEANYNPLTGCLPMLLQFPIILSFYRIFLYPAKFAFTTPGVYDAMQKNLFYISNLDHPDKTIIFPLIAAGLTALASYLTQKNNTQNTGDNDQAEQAQQTMKTMMYMMPIMIFIFARRMAAGLVLYWIVNNISMIVEETVTKFIIDKKSEEDQA